MDNVALVERFRLEDAEEFFGLVRMHLSFVLDLNTEDCESYDDRKTRASKWTIGLPFAKKNKGNARVLEGSHLTLHVVNQMTVLMDFLAREENIVQEGIFRRTGKLKRQQDLKAKLVNGESVDLSVEAFSVHDCASVLKTILAELPEPLLMEAQYPAYCQVAELQGNEVRLLLSVQLLTLLLPTETRSFLRQLLSLLKTISNNEEKNRMSAANLATLFTPHLMCPRRLPPEVLHLHSQRLFGVVAFMIENSEQIFQVPDTLATDLWANWQKKERRKRSPLRQLNESICDGTTVNTVFSFVDRARTAQENGSNPTELELAKLYAHIQSLPDSAMKRRHVKNFNKKNGQVTPAVRSEERNKHRRTRSLKDSIKKHLSGFAKNGKACETSPAHNTSDRSPNSNKTPHLTSSAKIRTRPHVKEELLKISTTLSKENVSQLANNITRSKSCDNLNDSVAADEPPLSVVTRSRVKSPEARSLKRSTPVQSRPFSQLSRSGARARSTRVQSPTAPSLVLPTKRTSPVKLNLVRAKSPQTVTKSYQCTTPPHVRSDKGLHLIESDRGCDKQSGVSSQHGGSLARKRKSPETITCKPAKSQSPDLPPPVTPIRTPLSVSSLRMYEHGLPCPTPTNSRFSYVSMSQCRRLGTLATSTPACVSSSQVERNSSMSPITRSAQRMPRAMQETMMTPRSRKPVVSLSGTDLCHLSGLEHWSPGEVGKKLILEESENSDSLRDDKADSSLSATFRDYLYSRSALTASPADLSFSSRTDDFQSCSSSSGKASLDDLPSLEGQMSQSLLYCLDGNNPNDKQQSGRECSPHVCETAI